VYGALVNEDSTPATEDEDEPVMIDSSSAFSAKSSKIPSFEPIKMGQLIRVDPNWAVTGAPPNGCVFPVKYSFSADSAVNKIVPQSNVDSDSTTTSTETRMVGKDLINQIRDIEHPSFDFENCTQDDPAPVFGAMVVGVIPPNKPQQGKAPAPTNVKLKLLDSKQQLTMAMWSAIPDGKELTAYMSSQIGKVIFVEGAAFGRQNPLYDVSITAGPETRIWLGSTLLPIDDIRELKKFNLETFWSPMPVLTDKSDIESRWNDLNRGYEQGSTGDDDDTEEKSQV
jgi:hypothetical protein